MSKGHSRRVQALFTPEQYELLRAHAAERGESVSELVRETVSRYLLADLEKKRRQRALERICQGETPVSSWPEMEHVLETSRYEGLRGQ